MGFKGKFITEYRNLNRGSTLAASQLTQTVLANVPIISFVLTNTNFLKKEVINIRLSDTTGQNYKDLQVTTEAGKSYKFNYDTVGWQWYQGDYFLILNNKGKLKDSWQFKKKEYPLGTCPSCHGSKRCRSCGGDGYFFDRYGNISMCSECQGTGICQTCDIPVRPNTQQYFNPNPIPNSNKTTQINTSNKYKGRSPIQIQADIRKCENEIESTKRLLLGYELRRDYGIFYRQMHHNIITLEHKIQDLYRELDKSVKNMQ